MYGGGELILEGYSDTSFQSDHDGAKSQSDFVFKLNGSVVAWKSSKKATIADSTTEAEYIAASKAAKEVVWMKNYIKELGVVPSTAESAIIFYDNNGAIEQAKELRSHHHSKHSLRCYYLLREMTWDVYAILVGRLARYGHHKPCPVQLEYVARTVSFKKRIHPLSKYDRSISYALKDAFTLYKPVTAVIGRIGKEVPMSKNLP
ncbi:UNVERIFIED_CONTAM: hypothetical protein Scaly_2222600 [Sesamum calycinum]|uniref:Uncharacterized protein n=1 Tax=Sesamum calycinum TaxID=2727403 RepID=A0AAW2M917_9LAMI